MEHREGKKRTSTPWPPVGSNQATPDPLLLIWFSATYLNLSHGFTTGSAWSQLLCVQCQGPGRAPKTMVCLLPGLLVPRLMTGSVPLSQGPAWDLPLGLDGQMPIERPE